MESEHRNPRHYFPQEIDCQHFATVPIYWASVCTAQDKHKTFITFSSHTNNCVTSPVSSWIENAVLRKTVPSSYF